MEDPVIQKKIDIRDPIIIIDQGKRLYCVPKTIAQMPLLYDCYDISDTYPNVSSAIDRQKPDFVYTGNQITKKLARSFQVSS